MFDNKKGMQVKMRHILVADDEKNMRWALKKALFNDGYVIDEAENGAVALNKFESSIYDLIILDIKMRLQI
ncbi:response regulator [Thermoanaerobacterium butyriciformans]|uniref:Stage 0 sporulation protein A homolog n=1 Tax=Thermoanaerobacterium butyriciformans TaxID=1702242 RepID=A0ABS4NI03_9THEO|nr:response regulator [Thermoanaerobacterium butyriciformans]MBP2073295.1 CheY-like chemotaxis protein [Thermoanaerobacterium butyriciformans]